MKRYEAVLDVYALVTCYPQEASALALVTQLTALAYLQGRAGSDDLTLLLRLACDLGYIDERLYEAHVQRLD